jgi:retron-type reverse transcriptase
MDILKGAEGNQYSRPTGFIIDKGIEDLLRKLLKAGYVDIHNLSDRTKYDSKDTTTNSIGVPQGSIISPLLCNIFFHQIDTQLTQMKRDFDKGVSRAHDQAYKKVMREGRVNPIGEMESQLASKYPELKKAIVQAEKNQKALKDYPSRDPYDPNYKRMY